MHALGAGGHAVSGDDVYGGTFRIFDKVMRPLGLEATFVDMTDPDQVKISLRPNTKLIWLETTPQDSGQGLAKDAVGQGADLVIATGGDGTVMACATALAGSEVPLAVLPLGTGNLVATAPIFTFLHAFVLEGEERASGLILAGVALTRSRPAGLAEP